MSLIWVQRQKTIQSDFFPLVRCLYRLQIQSRSIDGHLHADIRLQKTQTESEDEAVTLSEGERV